MDQNNSDSPRRSPYLPLTLLLANLITIAFFITGGGSIMQVLWIYWLQSVILGAINVLRIMSYPMKAGSKFQGIQPVLDASDQRQSKVGNMIVAGFFMLHYGFFHLVYGLFLLALSLPDMKVSVNGTEHVLNLGTHLSVKLILLSGLAFALHHGISFIAEKRFYKAHPDQTPTADKLFTGPYARIVPMHLIIIFGPVVAIYTNENYVFLLFMLIKTVVDLELYRRSVSHPTPVQASGI